MTQNTSADSAQPAAHPPASMLGAWARRLGAWLRSALNAYAEYLVRIGWWRFFLIALLGLIAVAIFESLLPRFGNPSEVVTSRVNQRIKVDIRQADDGKLSVQVDPVARSRKSRSGGSAAENTAMEEVDPDEAEIRIDKEGIRIEARDRSGRGRRVVIDGEGMRVERERPVGSPSQGGAGGADAVATEAEARARILRQVAEATEAAVNRQLDGMTVHRVRRGKEHDVFVPLYFVLVFASAIIKVVGTDRRRALARAGAAEAEAEREVLRRQLLEARLQAMQAQVEPHFLFNTLASLEYLIETAPARASQMLQSLIRYLRAALPRMREQSTTLGREAELARAYLEILKFRMEDRLSYRIDIAPGLASAQFPPMMLLSVVENAIKHGLEPKPEGGTLALDAAVVDGKLAVTVSDTGMGFGLSPAAGTGLGLSNLRERLNALYGDAGGFVIESNPAGGTVVRIQVPYAAIASAPVVRETGDAGNRNSRGVEA